MKNENSAHSFTEGCDVYSQPEKVSHTPETFKVIGETVRELPEVDHGFFSFLGSNIIIHQIGLTKEQCKANTQLIASAPALLKENQELKYRIDELELEIKVLQQFDER